jgi:MFS family permease
MHSAGHCQSVETIRTDEGALPISVEPSLIFRKSIRAIPDGRKRKVQSTPVNSVPNAPDNSGSLSNASGGKALAGFLLSGFELALLGAILPAWGYHRDPPQFVAVGNYFLALAIGIVFAALVSRRIMDRRGLTFLLVSACALSCVSLAFLGMVSPPASEWWRVVGLFALGAGAGLLNLGLLQAISGRYRADAAGAVSRGGVWYGLGCLAATLLVAGTFYA